MFDWVLNMSILFTINREKGIALEEVVWRYRALYKRKLQRKSSERDTKKLLEYRFCGTGIRIRNGWINKEVVK